MSQNTAPVVRIAVVDDERMILSVFSSLMKRSSYHVHFFQDALTALQKISQIRGHFHLVITDIVMPGMDGIEFAKKIRQVEPEMPIILMTGGASDEAREQALSMGRVVFLEKPFPLESTLNEFIPKFLKGEIN